MVTVLCKDGYLHFVIILIGLLWFQTLLFVCYKVGSVLVFEGSRSNSGCWFSSVYYRVMYR